MGEAVSVYKRVTDEALLTVFSSPPKLISYSLYTLPLMEHRRARSLPTSEREKGREREREREAGRERERERIVVVAARLARRIVVSVRRTHPSAFAMAFALLISWETKRRSRRGTVAIQRDGMTCCAGIADSSATTVISSRTYRSTKRPSSPSSR